jgi:L-fuculose-phosphate aldolase
MLSLGLVTGTFGNVSRREGEGILITPSGLDYETMTVDDLVLLDAAGVVIEGHRSPSSEFRLHVEIYRRLPTAFAIVHTHSAHAVALAERASELAPSADDVLKERVPVAPFRAPGTQELADGAARLMAERGARAVILQGHGVVGVGRNLAEALQVCRDVEAAAARPLSAAG